MFSSPIIDLAIGLTFVFGVTAALASFVTELISRLLGLRGAYLLSGLRELVDGGDAITDLRNAKTDYDTIQKIIDPSKAPSPPEQPSAPAPQQPSAPAAQQPSAPAPQQQPSDQKPSAAAALFGGPILGNQGVAGQFSNRRLKLDPSTGTGRLPAMTAYVEAKGTNEAEKTEQAKKTWKLWSVRRSVPSYISANSFADAVIDLVVPDRAGQTTMTTIQHNIDALPTTMPFRASLDALAKDVGDDVSRFRTSIEQWYDDHMNRVSGWYKRYVAKITLVAGVILVVLLNLNALTIGRTLYTENAVSAAVSAVAAKAAPSSCPTASQDCLADLESQLSAAAAAGLPIGWGTVRACTLPGVKCNWWDRRGIFSPYGSSGWQLVLVLVGFLFMIISLVPGAQFWFGLLTKLNTLRTTGPPPASAPSNPVSLTVVRPPVTSPPAVAAVATAAPSPVEQAPPQDAG